MKCSRISGEAHGNLLLVKEKTVLRQINFAGKVRFMKAFIGGNEGVKEIFRL